MIIRVTSFLDTNNVLGIDAVNVLIFSEILSNAAKRNPKTSFESGVFDEYVARVISAEIESSSFSTYHLLKVMLCESRGNGGYAKSLEYEDDQENY